MENNETVTKSHAITLAHAFAEYKAIRVSDLDGRVDYMLAATACKGLKIAQLEAGIELADHGKLVRLEEKLEAIQKSFIKLA